MPIQHSTLIKMTSLNYILARKLRKTKNKKQNGFTLIELMVVIAIVGVLSAVGLPELLKAQDSAEDSVALQEAVAAAKTCSMDMLTDGDAYATALADKSWLTVAGDCNVDGSTSTIVGTGPGKTHTIIVEDGIPSKPESAAVKG